MGRRAVPDHISVRAELVEAPARWFDSLGLNRFLPDAAPGPGTGVSQRAVRTPPAPTASKTSAPTTTHIAVASELTCAIAPISGGPISMPE